MNATSRQDHVCKGAASSSQLGGRTSEGHVNDAITALDMQSVQKAFESDLLKLSEDMSRHANYVSKVSAGQRQHAIAKVLKLKAENRRGASMVVDFMNRNARFVPNDFVEEHLNIMEDCQSPKPSVIRFQCRFQLYIVDACRLNPKPQHPN